jgi:hypothetical protein
LAYPLVAVTTPETIAPTAAAIPATQPAGFQELTIANVANAAAAALAPAPTAIFPANSLLSSLLLDFNLSR